MAPDGHQPWYKWHEQVDPRAFPDSPQEPPRHCQSHPGPKVGVCTQQLCSALESTKVMNKG